MIIYHYFSEIPRYYEVMLKLRIGEAIGSERLEYVMATLCSNRSIPVDDGLVLLQKCHIFTGMPSYN